MTFLTSLHNKYILWFKSLLVINYFDFSPQTCRPIEMIVPDSVTIDHYFFSEELPQLRRKFFFQIWTK